MTYNVFGGTLNLTQSVNRADNTASNGTIYSEKVL